MKKTGKFFMITGIMFALGILLCIIGVALGGSLAQASITQDKFALKSINKTMENPDEIKNLSIDISASDLILKRGNAFSIEGKGVTKCEVENGTWKIISKLKKPSHLFGIFPFSFTRLINSGNERKVTVTIPIDRNLDKISLDARAIDCKIAQLQCNKLDMEAGAGSIKMEELVCEKADLSIGAGDIRINQFQIRGEAELDCSMGDIRLGSEETRAYNTCNKMEASCNMGDIRYYGKLTGENEIDVTMGSIKLNLSGSRPQYDFSTDVTMGNINYKNDQNTAAQTAPLYGTGSLACTMGDITISFFPE